MIKKTFLLLLSIIIIISFSACHKKTESFATPDEDVLIENSKEYIEQMRSGDFETIYNNLPTGVKEQTQSAQVIQDSWNEAIKQSGRLLDGIEPEISCYHPENTDQIRVEFLIPCENEDLKVLINYDKNGNLYNYIFWKNNEGGN